MFADLANKENISADLPIISMEDFKLPAEVSRKRSHPSPSTSSDFSSDAKRSRSTTPENITEFISSKKTSPKMFAGSKKLKKIVQGLKLTDYPEWKAQMKMMSAVELCEFTTNNPELATKADRLFKKMVKKEFPNAKKQTDSTWKTTFEHLKQEQIDEKAKKNAEMAARRKIENDEKLAGFLERRIQTTTSRTVPNLPPTMALREKLRAHRLNEAKMAKRNGAEEPKPKKRNYRRWTRF